MDFSRPDNARKINRLKVLAALRRKSQSRAELSRELLINKVSISEIVDSLLGEGVVTEGGKDKATQGRPSTIISINRNGGRVFSLVFSSSTIMVSASNLMGQVIRFERFPNDENAAEALFSFISKMTADGVRIYGICIIGKKEDIPEDTFSWPVSYHSRVEAQVRAETEAMGGGGLTYFVSWGDTIEAALVDRTARAVPSFGHMRVTSRVRCTCGGEGCLSAVASGLALKEKSGIGQYRQLVSQEKGLMAIDDVTGAMAFAISQAVQATGAERVVLTGELSAMPRDLYATLSDKMKTALPPERRNVELVKGEKGEKALLEGAGILALDEYFYSTGTLELLSSIR